MTRLGSGSNWIGNRVTCTVTGAFLLLADEVMIGSIECFDASGVDCGVHRITLSYWIADMA